MTNLFCVCNKSYDSIYHKKSEQYIIKTDELRGHVVDMREGEGPVNFEFKLLLN